MQKLTNDKNSEKKDVDNNLIDTKEEKSQTFGEKHKNNMLIPLNTGLTIIKPKSIKKFRNFRKIRLVTVYIISLTIVAFSFFQIGRLQKQKEKTITLASELRSYISESTESQENLNERYIVDFGGLKKINPDTKGWIKVNGVGIDLPVVQSTDNSYYLKHSFDKSYNVCGWIFADYRNNLDATDRNTIIYGHNRRDGTMFSPMANILESDWYDNDENRYITFLTEEGESTYEVFSIYQVKAEDFYIQTNFPTDEKYQEFLDVIKSRSVKKYDTNLTTNDKILTISTCGKENEYRVVLHAKRI